MNIFLHFILSNYKQAGTFQRNSTEKKKIKGNQEESKENTKKKLKIIEQISFKARSLNPQLQYCCLSLLCTHNDFSDLQFLFPLRTVPPSAGKELT